MHIVVAGRAFVGGPGKLQRGVAFLAIHCRVLPFQRKSSGFVFEFEFLQQRLPAFGGVAGIARYFDFAVRMLDGCNLRMCGSGKTQTPK